MRGVIVLVVMAVFMGGLSVGACAGAESEETDAGKGCALKPPLKRTTPHHTAVVDVEFLLRNDGRLEHQLAVLLDEVETHAQEVAKKREEIKSRREQLRKFRPDTPEYKKLDQEIHMAEAEIDALEEFKRKEFRRREAHCYLAAYHQIHTSVAEFAEKHNIAVVVNYDSDGFDPNTSEDFAQEVDELIKRGVVYQKSMNITYDMVYTVPSAKLKRLPARPIEELRASGLRFPYHRGTKKSPPNPFFSLSR